MINDILTEDRRLVILRSLMDCNNEANESILNDCLDAYGHNVSRDLVRTQIDWLQEQGLVTVEDLRGFYIVTITGRGQDVAEGRASKVDLLPENVRKTLHEMLRDKAIPQAQILDEINALIDDAGLPEDMRLSRSGLNRYASSVEQVGHNLRQMREMTQALTTQQGDKPMGETTKLILEMGRSQLFKALMRQIENPEAEVDIDMLKNAMLAAQRLESTAMSSHKREKEIRQAFAEEAANAVSDELRGQDGMSEELEQRIGFVE